MTVITAYGPGEVIVTGSTPLGLLYTIRLHNGRWLFCESSDVKIG